MTPPILAVRLWGGLGNRLFMLARARAMFPPTERPEIISFSQTPEPFGGFVPSPDVWGLSMAGSLVDTREHADQNEGIRFKLQSRMRQVMDLVRDQSLPTASGRLHQIQSQGRSMPYISGYFQDFCVVEQAVNCGWPAVAPGVYKKTSWFEVHSSMVLNQKPLGIHIRLKDYTSMNVRMRIGLLPSDYYTRALRRVQSASEKEHPIWLFSDAPEEAAQFMADARLPVDHLVRPSPDSSPAESLSIMSSCASLVISNSTFSWWAARWSGPDTTVAAPEPWYRTNLGDNLLHPEWLLVSRR